MLQAFTLTFGFHSCFGLPCLLCSSSPWRALLASIQIWGKFWIWASRSSTALVVAVWHWRVLWASLRASAGAISIGWLGRCLHSWLAPALAAGERLNRALTGNLPQQPCQGSSAVNESCYTFEYCNCSNAEFVCNRRWVSDHSYQFLRHFYIIITDSYALMHSKNIKCMMYRQLK